MKLLLIASFGCDISAEACCQREAFVTTMQACIITNIVFAISCFMMPVALFLVGKRFGVLSLDCRLVGSVSSLLLLCGINHLINLAALLAASYDAQEITRVIGSVLSVVIALVIARWLVVAEQSRSGEVFVDVSANDISETLVALRGKWKAESEGTTKAASDIVFSVASVAAHDKR